MRRSWFVPHGKLSGSLISGGKREVPPEIFPGGEEREEPLPRSGGFGRWGPPQTSVERGPPLPKLFGECTTLVNIVVWWMGFHKIVLWCECGLPPAWITPPLPPLGMHNTAALVASAMWAISVVSVVSVISVISVNQSSSFSELSVTASDPNNPPATPA